MLSQIQVNTDNSNVCSKVGNWRELILTFAASQDVKDSSRALYRRCLRQYFQWLTDERKTVAALTRQDVLQYKDAMLRRGLSPLTVGSYIMVVRRFYEWTEANKLYPNIAKGVKTPRKKQAFKKQHLSERKIGELLAYCRTLSLRDYAIVNLLLRCGLRTVEVIRADIGDITFRGDRRVLRVWGKGRDTKDDFVVLTDKAYAPIRRYLAEERRHARPGEPLFVSVSHQNAGQRLTTRTLSKLCKGCLTAIGMDGREFTAHSLRHTAAVTILKHGGTITDVQEVLRHTSPVTSQIYTESVKEELRLRDAPEQIIDTAF